MADTVYFFLQSRRNRRALGVSQEGTLIAYKPGTYGVTARTFGEERLQYDFDVTIAFPPVADVQIDGIKNTVYAETSIPLIPVIIDESGAIRDNVEYTFSTSKEDVAMIDASTI